MAVAKRPIKSRERDRRSNRSVPASEPVASVSVYGPGWRFPGDGDVSEIERLVRETAERVGGLLAG